MRKLPYQSSLQFIQRPQLLWNDIGDRKLWRGIQWIRRGPTVPSRLSWNAYQSNIPKPRSGVRWKHGMRRFSEYGNVASTASATKSIRVSNDMSCRYFRGCNAVQDSKWIVVLVKTIVSNKNCVFPVVSCTFVIFGNWVVSCCIQCGIWTVFMVLDNEWASEFSESVMYWMSILLPFYICDLRL